MFRMELAPPIEDRVFLCTCWTLRTVSLRAAPSVMRVGAYTAFRLVGAVRLLMPVPIAVCCDLASHMLEGSMDPHDHVICAETRMF
jgi:hypothetical protein